ncbi:MAG: SLBB domain-containing protein [Fimbriimonadaceae bacterium]|nr:SLBB domain-containing protein [Fimbriimonadaceae bacterium]
MDIGQLCARLTMNALIQLVFGLLLAFQQTGSAPIKLKVGDTVTIEAPSGYGGSFTLLNDGSIYGRGFGKVVLAGKTWEESEQAVKQALKRFVKPEDVHLYISSQRAELVYLVGLAGGKGPAAWRPDLTLRQLLANSDVGENLDKVEVSVFRSGSSIYQANLDSVLKGQASQDPKLSPDDVVTITPIEHVRVWVSGAVRNPGEVRIPKGSDLYRALTAAGGLIQKEAIDDEATIVVRRGPTTKEYPAREIASLSRVNLEAGDDISVVLPEAVRVSVMGEVASPGEYLLTGGPTLSKAVAIAGGPTTKGTLSRVMVVRNGEMSQVDVSKPDAIYSLKAGDLVVIPRNERVVFVMGEVNEPKRLDLEDNREYRVTDALALAGGLRSGGTYRRVYLARPDKNGKVQITQFNLDEYLKDGKLESNPILQPGDSLLFGRPNGLSFAAAGQIISSFILIDSLGRGR